MRGRGIVFLTVLMVLQGMVLSEAPKTIGGTEGFRSPRIPPRSKYTIHCSVDPGAGKMEGTETILLKNTTMGPIGRMAMTWATAGGQTLDITANGRMITLEQGLGSNPIVFSLPEAIAAGRDIKLDVKFGITVPAGGGYSRTDHDDGLVSPVMVGV